MVYVKCYMLVITQQEYMYIKQKSVVVHRGVEHVLRLSEAK